MGHLIRRNTLRKKFGADSQQLFLALITLRAAHQPNHRLVVQSSQLHHAQLLLQSASAQLVRPS